MVSRGPGELRVIWVKGKRNRNSGKSRSSEQRWAEPWKQGKESSGGWGSHPNPRSRASSQESHQTLLVGKSLEGSRTLIGPRVVERKRD